ncbi:MAG: hypothetical protein RBS13_05600 [Bacteroidales bacterium]|jgi:hypothetical protein|nr:hypothetical protein [Bacteroidales bacterium]
MENVVLLFGKEEINVFLEKDELSNEMKFINLKIYYFDTEIEKNAFLKGINEAVGWQEVLEIEN